MTAELWVLSLRGAWRFFVRAPFMASYPDPIDGRRSKPQLTCTDTGGLMAFETDLNDNNTRSCVVIARSWNSATDDRLLRPREDDTTPDGLIDWLCGPRPYCRSATRIGYMSQRMWPCDQSVCD